MQKPVIPCPGWQVLLQTFIEHVFWQKVRALNLVKLESCGVLGSKSRLGPGASVLW